MGYSISLTDPVTGETLHSKFKHEMKGSIYAVEGTTELWLSITYNYAQYYNEATKKDKRFANTSYREDEVCYGIRGIYGKTGAESIPMLEDMISRIEKKYKNRDGSWKTAVRKRTIYFDQFGNEIDVYKTICQDIQYTEKHEKYEVNEGDTSDYWERTAANALRPLHQLLAMARIRPDGVWKGD